MDLNTSYIQDVVARMQELKKLAEGAIAQIEKDQLFQTWDEETNSIAITMKHVAGNMRSRWKDFLTTDGEKPDRNRDSEFVVEAADDVETLMKRWQEGWSYLFETLGSLTGEDLERTVYIRKQPHTVYQAINRQLIHYGCHVGQIVFMAKHLAAGHWKSLSVPRGGSQALNRAKGLAYTQPEGSPSTHPDEKSGSGN
ncbi:DUF1572 domain-containing protein [bacterium]|nr:DUF1572 domain-containing protein [bacterium]